MLRSNATTKKVINAYIIMFIIVIIIIITAFLMLKYQVEGEKNLPFQVSNIRVLSTATSNMSDETNGVWTIKPIQNNDIYITIAKNSKYKKNEIIKSIKFNNFEILKQNDLGNTNVYKINPDTNKYVYSVENICEDIKYNGAELTNVGLGQINNQGGIVSLSIATTNLGEVLINENEKIASNGTILNRLNLTNNDISFQFNFDIIIETESNHKFKANISLNLPEGDIIQDGVTKSENSNIDKIVFKRI